MRKYAVALAFLLVTSGCGGSSDTATPATTVAPVATQAPTTTVVPTTTVAATTTAPPTTTTAPTTTVAPTTTATPTTTVVPTTTAALTTTTATPTTTVVPTTTVAPTTTASPEPLEIWEEVYAEIRRIAAERPRRGQTISLRTAPGFSEEHLEVVTTAYTEAADFWSGGFDFAETILLVVVDETDRTWWETEMSLLEGERFNPGWFSAVNESAAHGMVEVDTTGVPHIVSATGSQTDFGQSGRVVLAQLVAHHETTHWFQYLALGSNTDRCLQMGDPSCPWTYLPCWLTEGHAELYMKAFADGIEDNPVPSSAWRAVRLATIGNSVPDAASVTAQGWLDYLWLPRTSTEPPCIGSGGTLSYPLGLPTSEILFYDFGDAKINEWLLTTGTYPSSASCPSWFHAFEDVFGVSVENWYRTSAVPYLLDTFSSDHSSEDALTSDSVGPPPYCQPGQVGSAETDTVVGEVGSTTVAPTTTTTVPPATETAGVQDGTFATCGSFLTPSDAQTWFDANPDFGESVDGNGDGTACGDGDFGGATDCNGAVQELVLPQFCPDYQYGPSGEDS